MHLSKLEKETIFVFNELEDYAEIYTYSTGLKTSLKKLESYDPEVKCTGGNETGAANYNIPKNYIKLRGKNKVKPEVVRARAERMKNIYKNNKQ